MATVTEQILSELRTTNDRVTRVEKMMTDKSRVSDSDLVAKAFMANGGRPTATMGWDGASSTHLLTGFSRYSKACGMGRFLQLVNEASRGHDTHVVEKSLAAMESYPMGHTINKDLAGTSGVTGGYTIPPEYYKTLLRLVAEKSVLRDRCMVIPMLARELHIPALDHSASPAAGTSGIFAGIAATWTPEGAVATATEPTFRQAMLVARDLVFTMFASNQLLADNAVALDILLTTMFTEAMAWFMEYYLLRGLGTTQPLGVLNSPCQVAVARAAASSFSLADAANMYERLLPGSEDSALWVMHKSLIPQLIRLADSTNGRLVWLNQFPNGPANEGGGAAQKLPMNLLGLPIYFTEKTPKLGTLGDVMLVDFSKVLLGERQTLQVESSREARFTQNQTVWRIVARYDSQPWLNAPLVGADGSGTFTMSNVVVLSA